MNHVRASQPKQPALFREIPPARASLYVDVAVPLPVRGSFSYAVPPSLAAAVVVGARVAVPFGPQRLVGYVLDATKRPPAGVAEEKLRPIVAVLDTDAVFPPELLRFLREAADYYLHPIGEVLRTAAPAVDRRARGRLGDEAGSFSRARWAAVKEESFVRLTESAISSPPVLRGGRQTQLLAILEARGEVPLSELRAQWKGAPQAITALEAKSIVFVERREIAADPFFGDPVPRDTPPALTEAQSRAVDAIAREIEGHRRATFLLHGVTGSGKTEVYLRAVDAAQRSGKGALILLPEIALTPQLVARYRARFGDNLAVLHSGMPEGERFAMWRRLRSGECSVAIGARSAIFAPIRNLGVILVDEEHDGSFKQEDNFRYNGRDLAVLRAHRAGIVCVLGSATPSLESYHAAINGRFHLLELPDRATAAPMPRVEIVDMRRVGPRGPGGVELLSPPLVAAIHEALGRSEQGILFLNRRGFAPSVRCEDCNVVLECPACSVALVLHRRERQLKCHYCDFAVPFQGECPKCHGTNVQWIGTGTEKVEENLTFTFPRARIGRLDRDVASGTGAEAVLDRLRRGEIDLLVGTQMVTKGHDVPRVTLVGVLSADAALSFPDFRASERTFQLLTQVAGRAGRRELPGRVLIQTFQPEHPAIVHARSHDYVGFFVEEIANRRELEYPPFGRLAVVRVDATDASRAGKGAHEIAEWLRAMEEVRDGDVRVLGPTTAPIEKLRQRWRMQILVRARERPPLRQALARLLDRLDQQPISGVRVIVDIDPVNML